MKKNILLSGMVLASFTGINAQQQKPFTRIPQSGNYAVINKMLLKQFKQSTGLKPTGLQQRVIGQNLVMLDGGSPQTDSISFRYTGNHGSRYDFANVGYPESFEPAYAPMHQDYRYGLNAMDMLADTILNFSEGELTDIERAHYRSDKKIDSIYAMYDNGGTPDVYYTNLMYNSAGAITAKYTLKPAGSSVDTTGYIKYYYNAANTRQESDSLFVDPLTTNVMTLTNHYSYSNATDTQPDTLLKMLNYMGTVSYTRDVFDYYTDGRLRKVTSQTLENGTWHTDGTDSLGYTGSLDYVTYWKQSVYDASGNNITDEFLTEYYPNTAGLPDSVWQYTYDDQLGTWEPQVKWHYTFNSYNNPTRFEATYYDSGVPQDAGYIDFYYEIFDDGLSIDKVTANANFSAYPNPFRNELNIDWKPMGQSKATVRLFNIVGQEVLHQTMDLQQGKNALSVPDLAAGQYILSIRDEQGKTATCKVTRK